MFRATPLLLVCAAALGCADGGSDPTAPFMIPVFEHGASPSPNSNGGNFGTPLSADEEVMLPGVINTSKARGNAIFQLSADGQSLDYKLIVANIENVFQAHIHMAPAGSNGGIVVWLYPSTAPVAGPMNQGRIQGVIAEGTITAANLVGALGPTQPGGPFALSALIDAMKAGNTYVNVHTSDGVNPRDTGPGDYPGGEVRGQIEHRGH